MSNTLRDFERALARFARDRVPTALGDLQKTLAREALKGVILRTPVASGRARANWRVGLDAPPEGTTVNTDPSGAGTLAEGMAVIERAQPNQSIWLANNLSYAEDLEHGRAGQAPHGMVAATVVSLRARFGGGRLS